MSEEKDYRTKEMMVWHYAYIQTVSGIRIADMNRTNGNGTTGAERDDNGKRFVACWNACEAYTTRQLNNGAISTLVSDCDKYKRALEAMLEDRARLGRFP